MSAPRQARWVKRPPERPTRHPQAGLRRWHSRSPGRSPTRSTAGAESRPAISGRRWPPNSVEERQRPASLAPITVGRCCEPEEVAERIAFPVSPRTGFNTREIVDIRGGLNFDQGAPIVERIAPAIDFATELEDPIDMRGKLSSCLTCMVASERQLLESRRMPAFMTLSSVGTPTRQRCLPKHTRTPGSRQFAVHKL